MADVPLLKFYPANDPDFRYTGRIDFLNTGLARFWAPGVYVTARFAGTTCEIHLLRGTMA